MKNALKVVDGLYPFGKSTTPVRVQEVQTFSSLESLKEKKREVIMKADMVNHPAIIKVEDVTEAERKLIYSYEWVPHSLETYLTNKR